MVDLRAILRNVSRILKNEDPPEAPDVTLLIEERVYTPPPGGDFNFESIGFFLRVESLRATSIERKMGVSHDGGVMEERVWEDAAYEVTFKTVLDEAFTVELFRMVRDHQVLAMVKDPDAKGDV